MADEFANKVMEESVKRNENELKLPLINLPATNVLLNELLNKLQS